MMHVCNGSMMGIAGPATDLTIDKLTGLASWIQADSIFTYYQGTGANNFPDRAVPSRTVVGTGNDPLLVSNVINGRKGFQINSSKGFVYDNGGGGTMNGLDMLNSKSGFTCHAVIKLVSASALNITRTIFNLQANTFNQAQGAIVQFLLINNQVAFKGRRVSTDATATIVPAAGNGTFVANEAFLYSCRVNFTTKTVDLYKNGILVFTTSAAFATSGNTTALNADNPTNIWGADTYSFQNAFQNEFICEAVVCTVASSDTEMTAAFTHLNKEYKLW